MREYERSNPLIVVHIPKTAGNSCREVFADWFGQGFLPHYYDEVAGNMPEKREWASLCNSPCPVAIFGHFNRRRGFGVEDYYPQATQFVTFLRDPFERAVSNYFFLRHAAKGWLNQSAVPQGDLESYLRGLPAEMTMLNFMPSDLTLDNYSDILEQRYVEIGVVEHMDTSMQRIASKLGFAGRELTIPHLNVSERDQRVPYELRAEFAHERPLEFAIYDYALNRYTTCGDTH